jgi:hypothetical protein
MSIEDRDYMRRQPSGHGRVVAVVLALAVIGAVVLALLLRTTTTSGSKPAATAAICLYTSAGNRLCGEAAHVYCRENTEEAGCQAHYRELNRALATDTAAEYEALSHWQRP